MRALRVTVCELPDDRVAFLREWQRLAEHVRISESALVVLPEMPFAPWLAASPDFNPRAWDEAVVWHSEWLDRLPELSPAAVVSSRPVTRGRHRFNEGFTWSAEAGYQPVHDKRFLPNEDGYWEARWYEPGDGRFETFTAAGARLGQLICTDLWSFAHAEQYGEAGAEIVAIPRATGRPTVDKWLVGGRAAAIVSGAFSVSSNWSTDDNAGDFGGTGWIIDPDGRVLATTTRREPFATVAIDLDAATAARDTYPRYALRS
jgi:predicted amidohydrolase